MVHKNTGKNNGMWKGDEVGDSSLHEWVRNHKPKSMFCEKCGKITSRLDCANISGEYKRDISDFRFLCRRCHMFDDKRLDKLITMNQAKKVSIIICRICKKKSFLRGNGLCKLCYRKLRYQKEKGERNVLRQMS